MTFQVQTVWRLWLADGRPLWTVEDEARLERVARAAVATYKQTVFADPHTRRVAVLEFPAQDAA